MASIGMIGFNNIQHSLPSLILGYNTFWWGYWKWNFYSSL